MLSVLGDASDPEVRKTNIEARGLIAVSGTADLILSVCRIAREEFNVPAVIRAPMIRRRSRG